MPAVPVPAVSWSGVKQLLNAVNGSTLLGLAVGAAGRCAFHRGPRGMVVATGYRLSQPRARAFTVGNVVLTPHDLAWLRARPRLIAHEERHSWQYVACLGLPMLPLYAVACGWSYLRGGDYGVHNPFERAAGLADGGYPLVGARALRRAARDAADPRTERSGGHPGLRAATAGGAPGSRPGSASPG